VLLLDRLRTFHSGVLRLSGDARCNLALVLLLPRIPRNHLTLLKVLTERLQLVAPPAGSGLSAATLDGSPAR